MKRSGKVRETSATRKARAAWAAQFPRCWACGRVYAAQTHHVIGAGMRSNELANYSRLCAHCHASAHGQRVIRDGKAVPQMSMANILFLKWYFDGDNYSHPRLCELARETLPGPEAPAGWYGAAMLVDRIAKE